MNAFRHHALVGLLLVTACAPGAGPERVVEPRTTEAPAARGEALMRTVLLGAQNDVRSGLALPPLAWDDALATDARAYAETLARTGRFEHAVQPAGPGHQGENLFTGTRGAYSYREMVGYWIAERRDFVNAPVPSSSRTGRFGDVGHYSQIVWRDSRRMGCALASNATDDFLVCRYTPSGNVFGQVAY